MENNLPPFSAPSTPPSYGQVPPSMQPIKPLPPQTSWPTVVAIISLILGILGILGGIYQVFSANLASALSTVEAETADPNVAQTLQSLEKWAPVLMGVAVLGTVLAIFLVVCGIKLLNRSPRCLTLYKRWALAKLIFAVISVAQMVLMQIEVVQASMQQQGINSSGTPEAVMNSVMAVMFIVTAGFGLLFYGAFPVFVLIWFGRTKVREEIETWA